MASLFEEKKAPGVGCGALGLPAGGEDFLLFGRMDPAVCSRRLFYMFVVSTPLPMYLVCKTHNVTDALSVVLTRRYNVGKREQAE